MRVAIALLAVLAMGWAAPDRAVALWPGQTEHPPSSPPPTTIPQGEQGLALLHDGDYKHAIPLLREAARQEPDSAAYTLGYAEALLSAHYKFTALGFLEAAKPRFKDLAEFRYTLGLAHYLCYHYAEAIQVFQTLPQDDAKFHRVAFLIGNCYMGQGNLRQAEIYFRRAIELKPDDAEYYARLGKMLRMEGPGKLDEAIVAFKKAWELNQQDAYVGLHLGYCLDSKGNYVEAQQVLEQVVRLQPDLQPAHVALANVYEHNHQMDKAREERALAATLKPPPTPLNPR